MQVKDRNRNRRSIGVLAAVALVCQLGLAPHISLAGGHPNFALVLAAVVALSIGGEVGVGTAFAAGVVYDLSSTGPFGLMALLLPLAAYGLGIEVRDRVSEEPSMTLIPVAVASLAVEVLGSVAMLMFGQASSVLDALVFRALPAALLTFLAYLPFVIVLGRSRHGGTHLGQGGGRHTSRYTMGTR